MPGGLGVWPAATNLNDNGNATTNTTGITDHSSTTTRVTTGLTKFSTTAFSVVSGNAAANEGPSQLINGGLGATLYTVSAWVWLISGAATVRATLSDTVAGKQGGTAVALTATPQRVTVSATTGIAGITEASYIETTVQQVGTWRIGGWQVETGAIATPYVQTDGADAARTAGNVTLPLSGLFTTTQGWMAQLVVPGLSSTDVTASVPYGGGAAGLFEWRDDNNNRLLLRLVQGGVLWSVRRRAAGAGTDLTAAATFTSGTPILLVFYWTATTTGISLAGAAFTTVGNTGIPTLAATAGSFTQEAGADVPFPGRRLWAMSGNGTPTGADAALMAAWPTPPTINQIMMLSQGSKATALINCATADVTLLPGYFS